MCMEQLIHEHWVIHVYGVTPTRTLGYSCVWSNFYMNTGLFMCMEQLLHEHWLIHVYGATPTRTLGYS